MQILRAASTEEVVAYYITSELTRLLENANDEPIPQKAIKALRVPAEVGRHEGALQHFSRALLGHWRDHTWLHEQFWGRSLTWCLAILKPEEIDVMPLGGKPEEFHFPKLDRFVAELRAAAEAGRTIEGVHDDPKRMLVMRREFSWKRLIVVSGLYGGRHFQCAIGDGAHRAIALVASGECRLEAYLGKEN